MKQEYIIGDVVMYDNKIMVIEEPREESHFDLLWNNYIIYSYINIEEIKPILLTPEILEKNGWGHKDDVYFKEYSHLKLVVMDGNAYIINESCSLFLCKVEFVHGLQHLLYALHIDSNLKI